MLIVPDIEIDITLKISILKSKKLEIEKKEKDVGSRHWVSLPKGWKKGLVRVGNAKGVLGGSWVWYRL